MQAILGTVVDSCMLSACHNSSSLQSRMESKRCSVTALLQNLLSQQQSNRNLLRPNGPSPLPEEYAPQPSDSECNRLSKHGQQQMTFCPRDCSSLAAMEPMWEDKDGQHLLGPWDDVLISAAPLTLVDSPCGDQSACCPQQLTLRCRCMGRI